MKFIFLVILIIICDACSCFYKPELHDIAFNISAVQRSNSYFSFKVLIKNNGSNPIAILNYHGDTLGINKTYLHLWKFDMLFNDSIEIGAGGGVLPNYIWPRGGFLLNLICPNCGDYQIIKPNQQIELYLEIDIKKLYRFDKYYNSNDTIPPYGTYTCQLFYKDFFLDRYCAIDSLISNKIEINYLDK